jgi:hypothetical protein
LVFHWDERGKARRVPRRNENGSRG